MKSAHAKLRLQGPPGLQIVTHFRKGKYFFFETIFGTFQETLLGPFFDRFWDGLGIVSYANKDLTENIKIVFLPRREPNNEGSEASQKPSKIDKNRKLQDNY